MELRASIFAGAVVSAAAIYVAAPEGVRFWARQDRQAVAYAVSLIFGKNSRMTDPLYQEGYQPLLAKRQGHWFAVVPREQFDGIVVAAKEAAQRTADAKKLLNWDTVKVNITYKLAGQLDLAGDVILCAAGQGEDRPMSLTLYPDHIGYIAAVRDMAAGFVPEGYKVVRSDFFPNGERVVKFGPLTLPLGNIKIKYCSTIDLR